MVTFKFNLSIFCLLFLGVLTTNAQSNKPDFLLKQEQQRFAAMIRKDTTFIKPMLADDLVYIHSNALRETKAEHLITLGSGRIIYQTMDRINSSVRMYGKKIGIVSGTIKVSGLINGNPFDTKMLYTAVYCRNKGVWQLTNWQTTKIP